MVISLDEIASKVANYSDELLDENFWPLLPLLKHPYSCVSIHILALKSICHV